MKYYREFSVSENKRWLLVRIKENLVLVDLKTLSKVKEWAVPFGTFQPTIDNACTTVLTSSPSGSHYWTIIDVESSEKKTFGPTSFQLASSFLDKNDTLLFGTLAGGGLGIFDWKSKSLLFRFRTKEITKSVDSLTISKDGHSLFLCGSGIIQKWSLQDFHRIEKTSPGSLMRTIRQKTQLKLEGSELQSTLSESEAKFSKN